MTSIFITKVFFCMARISRTTSKVSGFSSLNSTNLDKSSVDLVLAEAEKDILGRATISISQYTLDTVRKSALAP